MPRRLVTNRLHFLKERNPITFTHDTNIISSIIDRHLMVARHIDTFISQCLHSKSIGINRQIRIDLQQIRQSIDMIKMHMSQQHPFDRTMPYNLQCLIHVATVNEPYTFSIIRR